MTTTNPYLAGNMAPVREELTDTDLAVTGKIPDYLDGRYLRNGPNPIVDPADPATHNWFMAAAMVHGIRLRDGRAEWYRNRYVRSPDVVAVLGEEPRPGPVHAGFDVPTNISVIGHAGRIFGLIEAGGRPYELTHDLDTIGPCDFDGTLPGGYTAHPLRDPASGELHAISYYFGWGDRVQYAVLGTDGRIRKTLDLEVPGSPMMHAFTLTEGHVVLYDLPVTFHLEPGETAFPYRWDPTHPARVGVLPLDATTADVRWFEVEPCFVYHPLNGYDDGDQIVIHLCRHEKTFVSVHSGPAEVPPTFERWTIDLVTGRVREERVTDRFQEYPRVDERFVGRPHRYGYALGYGDNHPSPGEFEVLYKHDLTTGRCDEHHFGAGRQAGEFVFVPANPEGRDEDTGVLMGFVYDASNDRSDLELLDAETLDHVATVHLPVRVPGGIHGNWIPTATTGGTAA